MSLLTLRDAGSGSTARIAPALGFNCFSFQAVVGKCVVDVIDAAENFAAGGQRPSGHGIPILFPFPNRIHGGRFSWDGREYVLPPDRVLYDTAGNAIHGFCLDRPWRVMQFDESSATADFQLSVDAPDRAPFWPADARIEVRYEVRGATLRADFRISNPDRTPLPWGLGTHPYFRLPLAGSDPSRCTFEAPVTQMWELADCIPTGRRLPLPKEKDLAAALSFDGRKLDDVYTGLRPTHGVVECTIIDEPAGLQVTQRTPDVFRELVACTPVARPRAICLEPYTCVTNAIQLCARSKETGLRTLAPGEEFRTWIEITAGKVIA